MDVLVVGDVHGCFHTFKKLIRKHWRPGHELLVQVGDLVNKGPHSLSSLIYWQKLEKKYGRQVLLLRGNHEQMLLDSLKDEGLDNAASDLAAQVRASHKLQTEKLIPWLEALPLKWDNGDILITHAGISKKARDPYSLTAANGILYNKEALKRLPSVQVKGHSIVDGNKPVFVPSENAWYIDTGAWAKKYLSALRISAKGECLAVIRLKTEKADKVSL